jgi:hypothetical protein
LAESGQFDDAVTVARQALILAQRQSLPEVAQNLDRCLHSYENHHPVRDLPAP